MRSDLVDARVGATVHDRRVQLGVSIQGLAAALSQPPEWVEAVEAGLVRLKSSQLSGLSSALGLTLLELLDAANDSNQARQTLIAASA